MAPYVDLANNKSQWSMRLTEFPKWHPVSSLVPIFSKLWDHQIRIPSEDFSLVGYKKDSCQKGRMLVLLKSQSTSLFPLINFLFLPDCPACSLFLCTRCTRTQFFLDRALRIKWMLESDVLWVWISKSLTDYKNFESCLASQSLIFM